VRHVLREHFVGSESEVAVVGGLRGCESCLWTGDGVHGERVVVGVGWGWVGDWLLDDRRGDGDGGYLGEEVVSKYMVKSWRFEM
jgi:hypothetical protein